MKVDLLTGYSSADQKDSMLLSASFEFSASFVHYRLYLLTVAIYATPPTPILQFRFHSRPHFFLSHFLREDTERSMVGMNENARRYSIALWNARSTSTRYREKRMRM